MEFSVAQKRAIHINGNSLLVSAAAGSGKTAVLVERVIQKILSGETDIDRMYIMTFTEAAAAEMRQKIEAKITESLELDPENERLQAQLSLFGRANISTIHAACKRIIEANFHALDIDPSATIGEETALNVLFERTLEEYLEDYYEAAKTEPQKKALIDFFSGGKNDEKLFSVFRRAYSYYEEQATDRLSFPHGDGVFDFFKKDELYTFIDQKLTEAAVQYATLLSADIYQSVRGEKMWLIMEEEYEKLQLASAALKKRSFDACAEQISNLSFASWNTKAKVYQQLEINLDVAKQKREYAKGLITSLQETVFSHSEAWHIRQMNLTAEISDLLFAAVRQIDERFTEAKRQKNLMSFSDLERFAVKLLVKEYDAETDTVIPSDIALAMRENIDEIIVDEYQDTNIKQDIIFRALSKDETNIFMVGDVKQSIYRFREACPELFLQKKQSSVEITSDPENNKIREPSYLYLNQNFRSHPTILNFANQVFGSSMSESLGQIKYDASEQLYDGQLYPEDSKGYVELDVVIDQKESELSKLEKQAEIVAEKVHSVHGQPFYDVKQKAERPITYGDIAVMCRTAKDTVNYFETALRRKGIYCVNDNPDQSLLDTWEVKMLRSFLQVLNNPYRDIPLITLLYSDFYCFSAAELAAIRTHRSGAFYDAVRSLTDTKSRLFIEEAELLRQSTVGLRSDEIIQMIFTRTHILDKLATYADGTARIANLREFARVAAGYESGTYKGLFSFLNYLDRIEAAGKSLPTVRLAENAGECVQLFSIHKSKGLEFPVCFIVNIEKEIKDKDTDTLITHRDLGVAFTMREDKSFTEYNSMLYDLIRQQNRREALSEEMRILYVALTRPKTHLYIVAAERLEKLQKLATEIITYTGEYPAEYLSSAPSFLKWILFALRGQEDILPLYKAVGYSTVATGRECRFSVNVYNEETERQTAKTVRSRSAVTDTAQAIDLAKAKYAFAEQTALPIKLSVSEIKGMREKDPEAAVLIPPQFGKRQPLFLTDTVAGNVKGNAVHKFMQFADFKELCRPGGIEKEAERLANEQFIGAAELELVDFEQITAFVRQPIFKDMVTAERMEKEKRFFFELPANEIFPSSHETAPVLLQGILDCYYEKNGQLIIVDYKTDLLNSEDEFIQRYASQLRLYREAVKEISGKKADKLYLYSFHLDKVIEIS